MRTPNRREDCSRIRAGCALATAALLLAAAVVASPVVAGEPAAPPPNAVQRWLDQLPFALTGEIEAGGQFVNQRGNGSYAFDEYRDLDTMGTIPSFYLRGEDKRRRGYVEMGGTNLTRMDAYYFANAGRYNYYRFFFEFDRIPHVLGNDAQTIFREADQGRFVIPASGAVPLQNALRGIPTATGVIPSDAQRQAVTNAVNGLLEGTKLGFQTDAARLGASWLVTPALELGVSYTLTERNGRIPLGTVIGSPGGATVELAIPRDERYHEMKVGAEYVRDLYQFRLNYTFSAFENFVDQIDWQGTCGVIPGGTNFCGIGATNTNPGAGRYSTMPDNFAHTIGGAGGLTLPWWNTRLTAAASYAFWRQDDTFLPASTSTSRNFDDAGATSPDAEMNVTTLNFALSSRPVRDVGVRLRYRMYDLQNETPVHAFTNILAPGDVVPAAGGGSTDDSKPYDFRKQNAGADVSWRVVRPLTLRAGYEYERWDRPADLREAAATNEHIFKVGGDVQPLPWLLSRVTYSHGVRTVGAGQYIPQGGNADVIPQFRKFDEADRTRDKGEVMTQITPWDTLTLSGTFYIQNDAYSHTDFGLYRGFVWGFSGDLSWAPTERLGLFAGYAHDVYQTKQQNCQIGRGQTACDTLNIFGTNAQDTLDSVNLGATYQVIPSRLDVSAGYRFMFGKSRYRFPFVPGDTVPPLAVGESDPVQTEQIENRFHIFNIVGRLFLTKNWMLKLGYQYERYEEQDFTTDPIQPALAATPGPGGVISQADSRSIVLGVRHPPYEAHIVAFSVGFLF